MAIINVPFDQPTITAGIAAAANGDTVLVVPGAYLEKVTINKSITLISSGGPLVTIIDPPAAVYYLVSIEADDVVLSGFTIINPDYTGTADASGILTEYAGRKSNIRITNCIIHDVADPSRTSASFGTYGINSGPVDGLEIDHCVIYNIANSDSTDSEAAGILVWGNGPGPSETAININIHDNTVYDISNPVDDSGIRIAGNTTDVTVSNNTVRSVVMKGIVTSAGMIGPITIDGNTVDGASQYGMLLRSQYLQTVTNNTVRHSGTGIYIAATTTAPVIHYNNIYRNTVGLDNESGLNIDLTKNWWGSTGGPNSLGGDTTIGVAPADYTPWLLQPYPPPVRGVRFW